MFRFTIRDVLWLTVVVGLATGWIVDRSRLARQLAKSEDSANTAWHALSHKQPTLPALPTTKQTVSPDEK